MSINDIEFAVSDSPNVLTFKTFNEFDWSDLPEVLTAWSGWQVNGIQQARDCMLPMGITSENVAQQYGVTREEQDQAAVSSLHLTLNSGLLI